MVCMEAIIECGHYDRDETVKIWHSLRSCVTELAVLSVASLLACCTTKFNQTSIERPYHEASKNILRMVLTRIYKMPLTSLM